MQNNKSSFLTKRIAPSVTNYQSKKTGIKFNLHTPQNNKPENLKQQEELKIQLASPRDNKSLLKKNKVKLPHSLVMMRNMKSSSHSLNNLYNFFAKADTDKGFIEFLKTPNGRFQTFLNIKSAANKDHIRFLNDMKSLNEDYDLSSDFENSFEYSGNLTNTEAYSENYDELDFSEEEHDYAENNIVNDLGDLSIKLSEMGLLDLSLDTVELTNNKINETSKQFPWLDIGRLDLASLTLRNSDSLNQIPLAVDMQSQNRSIDEILDAFDKDITSSLETVLKNNPRVSKQINKYIAETNFKNTDPEAILDFYIFASVKGYQEEANHVLMRALAEQAYTEEEAVDENGVEIFSKLFNFATELGLIGNVEEFSRNFHCGEKVLSYQINFRKLIPY